MIFLKTAVDVATYLSPQAAGLSLMERAIAASIPLPLAGRVGVGGNSESVLLRPPPPTSPRKGEGEEVRFICDGPAEVSHPGASVAFAAFMGSCLSKRKRRYDPDLLGRIEFLHAEHDNLGAFGDAAGDDD